MIRNHRSLHENIAHLLQTYRAADAKATQVGTAGKDESAGGNPLLVQTGYGPAVVNEKWAALDGLLDPFDAWKFPRPR